MRPLTSSSLITAGPHSVTEPEVTGKSVPNTPLLTLQAITEPLSRGKTVWIDDKPRSMDVSSSTSALGIAVALGEIQMPAAEQIHHDLSPYSSVASCSSGVEPDRAQIVVVGHPHVCTESCQARC